MADRAQMRLNVALPQESTFRAGGSVTSRESISPAQEQSSKIRTLVRKVRTTKNLPVHVGCPTDHQNWDVILVQRRELNETSRKEEPRF
jgi:hypothetical protein